MAAGGGGGGARAWEWGSRGGGGGDGALGEASAWRRSGGWGGPMGRRAWAEAGQRSSGDGDSGGGGGAGAAGAVSRAKPSEGDGGLARLRALAARRWAKGGDSESEPSRASEEGDQEDSDGSKEGWEELRAMASGPAGLGEEPRGGGDADEGSEDDQAIRDNGKDEGTKNEASKTAADAEKLSRTVFVGNVPVECKAKALKSLFSKHGAVVSVRLRSVPLEAGSKLSRKAAAMKGKVEGGRSTHAYVVFETPESAERALGSNMEDFEGKHLRVDRAAAPGEGKEGFDSARSVFIGNLDFDLEDEDVIKMIEEAHDVPQVVGHVEGVRLVRDKRNNMGKGFGFVLFDSKEAAKAALSLNGRKIKGRALRVTRTQRSSSQTRDTKSNAKRRIDGKGSVGEGSGKSRKASWQGVQTKGTKGMRESKQRVSARGGQAGAKGKMPEAKKGASGKRPAVAKRKAAAMAAKAQGGQVRGQKKPKRK